MMNSDKEKERRKLESSVEAFLQKGGRIQKVPRGRSGDKGINSYRYPKHSDPVLAPNIFKPINANGGFKRWKDK